MSTPRKSLNASVSWMRLLSDLGRQIGTAALPAVADCPLCDEGLIRIYPDCLSGGQWHWCPSCGSNGDMIELAAKAWELSLPAAIRRLERRNLISWYAHIDVRRYLKEQHRYKRRLAKLWESAQSGLAHPSLQVGDLLYRLGVYCDVPRERFHQGPAQVMGVLDKTSVERAFHPQSMRHADRHPQRSNPSANAVFKGRDWGDVLVVPCYDLPWRPCAFLFIGRNGDSDHDIVIKRANLGEVGNQHRVSPYELGISLHPANIVDGSEHRDGKYVAIRDPLIGLRLQMRHFEQGLRPLPVAIWYEMPLGPPGRRLRCGGRTSSWAWNFRGGRKVVFWMPVLDVATIRQAIHTQGWISTVGPEEKTHEAVQQYAWGRCPRELVNYIQETGRPWQEVLSKIIRTSPASVIEELVTSLRHEGEDTAEILAECKRKAQLRVTKVFRRHEVRKSTHLNGCEVTERKDGWYVSDRRRKRPRRIVDAILRVDTVICHQKTAFYRGRIVFRDEVVEFCDPIKQVEKDTFGWMAEQLIKAGKGLLSYNRSWSREAFRIATKFHPPKVVSGPESVGWDVERARLNLPKYSILLGGEAWRHGYQPFPEAAPAWNLGEPEELCPDDFPTPSDDGYVDSLFWASMAAVISSILAPAYFENPRGIGLQGPGAETVGRAVAETLGCLACNPRNTGTLMKTLDAESEHGWPLIVDVGKRVRRWVRQVWFAERTEGSRNCITRMDWHTAMAKAVEGSWSIICGERPVTVSEELLELANWFLPAYFQDLLERNLNIGEREGRYSSLVEQLTSDLARFVKRHGGNPRTVWSALDVLWPSRYEGHALSFADLVSDFVRRKMLILSDGSYAGNRPTLLRINEPPGLFLSKPSLDELLAKKDVGPLDGEKAAYALKVEGVLLDEQKDGWVFDEAWWRGRKRDWPVRKPTPRTTPDEWRRRMRALRRAS
ncbi:MAG: hypothetical protein ACYTG0_33405 [Planctomycetota bacterium]